MTYDQHIIYCMAELGIIPTELPDAPSAEGWPSDRYRPKT